MTQPTPDELKNGWTEETLTRYIKERDAATYNGDGKRLATLDYQRKVKPNRANGKFNPLRWRG